MSINDIANILIDYINKNKNKYNVDYLETIRVLKELLNEIEEDYYKL